MKHSALGPMRDLTLAGIRALDAGIGVDAKKFGGTRLPAFDEAPEALRGKRSLYLDWKDAAAEAPVAALRRLRRSRGFGLDMRWPRNIPGLWPLTVAIFRTTYLPWRGRRRAISSSTVWDRTIPKKPGAMRSGAARPEFRPAGPRMR